jgi:glyoxalase family protein
MTDIVPCFPRTLGAGGGWKCPSRRLAYPNDKQQKEWLDQIRKLHYNVSPVRDRKYSHSIYFREPGGVLFEIATDQPGFGVDEPGEALGTHLVLPPCWNRSALSWRECCLR